MSIIKVKCPECKTIFEALTPKKVSRTNRQNSYYWGVLIKILSDEIGYYPEEMHDALKLLFLRKHEEGKPETARSTSHLNTEEFTHYVERCRQWAAEQGYTIPDPQ